jgi:hypothetical protein
MSGNQNESRARKIHGRSAGAGLLMAAMLLATPRSEAADCVEFSGLRHCALGGSTLEATPERLSVSSPEGKSGGVLINTQGSRTWDAKLDEVELHDGARVLLSLKSQREDGSVVKEAGLAVESRPELGADMKALHVDMSASGAKSYTVRGYENGVLVYERKGIAPKPVRLVNPSGPGESASWGMLLTFRDPIFSMHGINGGIYGPGGCTPGFDWRWPRELQLGSETFKADLVTVTAEGTTGSGASATEVEVETVGVPSLSFTREEIGK